MFRYLFMFRYLKNFLSLKMDHKSKNHPRNSYQSKNKDALEELTIMDSSAPIKATVFANQFNLICHVREGNLYLISGCTVQDKFRTENTP
jgi:hypothetical protein